MKNSSFYVIQTQYKNTIYWFKLKNICMKNYSLLLHNYET